MKFQWTRVISVFIVVVLCACGLWAQGGGQGSVEGTVADSTGAVVPGVTLKLTNEATGLSFTAASNEAGYFRFPVVPVGNYDLSAESKSFASFTQKGFAVTVGSKVNLPITMTPATQKEAVEVTGELPVVETTRSNVASTVSDRAISELPVNGRNFIDFTLLTPGVVRDVRGGDLSFAGQRGTLNSLTIDGTDNNNTFFGQTLGRTGSGRAPYQFSEDAVQEFQVNTNGYSAELGRAGGAIINVVTKSGTNQYHGTAFEFFRDRALNANDPIYSLNRAFAVSQGRPQPLKAGYHYNQFGGNFGGPIIKDKLFFFFDYDGQRNNIGNVVALTLPSTANPATFDQYQQAAYAYLQARANSYPTTFNQNVYLGKLDWIVNSRQQVSIRYNAQRFLGGALENSGASGSTGVPSTSSFEHTGNSNVNTDSLNLQHTWTLSNSLINVAKFSYQRDNEPGFSNSNNPEALVREGGQNLLFVGRNSFSPRETTIHRQQYADTLSYVRGNQTFKLGFDIVNDHILNFFPGNFSGAYTFASLEDFGLSLAGLPASSSSSMLEAFPGAGTTGPRTTPNMTQYGGFLQDDIRVTRNLTVNVGVRYDLQTYQQPTVTNPTALAANINTGVIHEDKNNFAPRLGFAYSPFGDNRTVIRGGYGMFYGNTPSILIGTALSNNGINVQTLSFKGAALPSYPNNVCGTPTASPNCAAPTSGGTASAPTIYAFDNHYVQPLVHQYNLQVERQVGKDMSVSVGYLGVKGTDLTRTRDINEATPTPASIQVAGDPSQVYDYLAYSSTRPIAGFSRIFQFESTASSWYNGLVLTFNKRFSDGFRLGGSYTWSHAIDDAPDATAVVPGADDAKLVYYPTNFAFDRSSSLNDVRHRFVLNGQYDFDRFANNFTGAARRVLGGWELSGILTAQSGQPYSAFLNSDLNNDANSRNERVPGTARNTYYLPSIYSFDPRITKNVKITERVNLKLIGEAFNVTNHFNVTGVRNTLYNVGTNTASATPCSGQAVGQKCLIPQLTGASAFGLPSADLGPRILQLAAKISF